MGVVAAEMADHGVCFRKPVAPRGRREDQSPTRADPIAPGVDRSNVVFDVLEHFKGTDEVEGLALGESSHVAIPYLRRVSLTREAGSGDADDRASGSRPT